MEAPRHGDVLRRARELGPRLETEGRCLGVLSSSTLDFLRPHLIIHAADAGMLLDPWIGPFNQFEQLLLDATSPLWARQPAALWIHLRLEDADPLLYDETRGVATASAVERLADVRRRVVALAKAARAAFTGPIVVSNFTLDDQRAVDPFDATDPDGLTHLVADANRVLAREVAPVGDVHVFDYARCVASIGTSRFRDDRLWYMARAPVAAAAQSDLAAALVRTTLGALRPSAKCIVLDLDHTLWGGVLGDDGLEGLQLGDDYPGSAYKRFQQMLLGYRRRGFLLAICSKNDEAVVRHALEAHPEMMLRSEHFAAIRANWDPKPVNLRRIAEELSLGLESFVFVDDNPLERATIRAHLPMVHVVELPKEPYGYVDALRAVPLLDRARVVGEDRERAEMYAVEARRQALQRAHATVDEFLQSLEMHATVGILDEGSAARIHQLVGKTNQFNLTTRRHSAEHLRRVAASPEGAVLWLRLADRFGDLGLVAVAVVERSVGAADTWVLDTFLMSCRVMGRGVEAALLARVGEVVRSRGGRGLIGEYLKTAKNQVVERFFADHGFERTEWPGLEGETWRVALEDGALPWPRHVRRADATTEG